MTALQTIRREPPLTLIREALWRAEKRWRRLRLPSLVARKHCPVQYRPAGYYSALPIELNASTRQAILHYAELVRQGSFCWFGYGPVALGMPPRWQFDFVSGKDWPLDASTTLRIVRHDGSDVKAPWELSRLQFLPVLGKAWRLTGDRCIRQSTMGLLSDWIEKNPVGLGVNWTVAMEAALRGISICLLMELLTPFSPAEQAWLDAVTKSLWQHLLFIEAHNEFSHFARSNHYLSNIVGLFCLSAYLASPETDVRCRRYFGLVEREITHQVYDDGGSYESSVGYHVLIAQMFTIFLLLARARKMNVSSLFLQRLTGMYQFMAALADRSGSLPQVGDCDDGRVELMVDDVEQLVGKDTIRRDSLAVSSLLGLGGFLLDKDFGGSSDDACWHGAKPKQAAPSRNRAVHRANVFPRTGVAIARRGNSELLFFAMPNGIEGKGSHTHNDKLSLILRIAGYELFADCGTFCYSRNTALRNWFRSTVAHNTVRVDGQEQNCFSEDPSMLFRMEDDAAVSVIDLEETDTFTRFRAEHRGYQRLGVIHVRSVSLADQEQVLIEDDFAGTGEHLAEATWHLPDLWQVSFCNDRGCEITCVVNGPQTVLMRFGSSTELKLQTAPVEISKAYGSAYSGTAITVSGSAQLPLRLTTSISWKS